MFLSDSTETPLIPPENNFSADHLCPFQCTTRDPVWKMLVSNAHTSDGDTAAAAVTSSSGFPGNATRVQVAPFHCHAVGPLLAPTPSNAHPVVPPVATT